MVPDTDGKSLLALRVFADQRLDQRVGQPVFILLRGPSSVANQQAVEVAAGERPQDVACVFRVEAAAQATRADEVLNYAALRVVASAFAFRLRLRQRGSNSAGATEQIEDRVLRLVDTAGDAR